jgi:hypothetical protein
MSKKAKLATANSAKLGDTYQMVKIEVQTLGSNGKWSLQYRFDTLDEAKEFHEKHTRNSQDLRWVFDCGGAPKVRYVEVDAMCKIVA